ncbi:hypothetical protein [Paludisphaera soli]|uniref:hypothetical protein n=1 Tax=Paludisphaera soli TaxID=2712865 RepID=UPI0013EC21B5|nr:hypothetical protein [Paludisphaera soli]
MAEAYDRWAAAEGRPAVAWTEVRAGVVAARPEAAGRFCRLSLVESGPTPAPAPQPPGDQDAEGRIAAARALIAARPAAARSAAEQAAAPEPAAASSAAEQSLPSVDAVTADLVEAARRDHPDLGISIEAASTPAAAAVRVVGPGGDVGIAVPSCVSPSQ